MDLPNTEILAEIKEPVMQGDIQGSISYVDSLKERLQLLPFISS